MGLFRSSKGRVLKDGKGGYSFKLDDSQTIYFKGEGITAEDAGYVAGYYKAYHAIMDLVNKTPKYNVHLSAATKNDPVQLGFIVSNADVADETISYFKNTSEGLQENFAGRQIKIVLLNKNFETLKVL